MLLNLGKKEISTFDSDENLVFCYTTSYNMHS